MCRQRSTADRLPYFDLFCSVHGAPCTVSPRGQKLPPDKQTGTNPLVRILHSISNHGHRTVHAEFRPIREQGTKEGRSKHVRTRYPTVYRIQAMQPMRTSSFSLQLGQSPCLRIRTWLPVLLQLKPRRRRCPCGCGDCQTVGSTIPFGLLGPRRWPLIGLLQR